MATPALATIFDLEARMGQVESPSRAQAALADASALIRAEALSVSEEDWTSVDGSGHLTGVPAVVVTVCCNAARRVLTNPDEVTSEQIADYQASYRESSGDVYLKRSEKQLVRRTASGTSGMGAIELESPYQVNTSVGVSEWPLPGL